MTEHKLESISTQMNAVYSSIAEVQNRFNEYYNSVQQNSERMNNPQDTPEDASNNELNTSQDTESKHVNKPAEEQEFIEAEPTIAVNTKEQINENNHEIQSVIHSLNHSLANIQHFIDNKKLTAAFRKELKSATEKLSESLEQAQASTSSAPTKNTPTPKN